MADTQIPLDLDDTRDMRRDGVYDYPAMRDRIADAVSYVCRRWDETTDGWRGADLDALADKVAAYASASLGTAIDRDVDRLGSNVAHWLIAAHGVPCRCHSRADRLEADHRE